MKLKLLCALLPLIAASAQETWKGLRFGMSVAQVRRVFPGIVRLSGDQQMTNCALSFGSRGLVIEGTRFTPSFCFSASTVPVLVTIGLDADLDEGKSLSVTGAELLLESLTEKYGAPITYDGDCRETRLSSSQEGFCRVTWRASRQSITGFVIWLDKKTSMLHLEYNKMSDDL